MSQAKAPKYSQNNETTELLIETLIATTKRSIRTDTSFKPQAYKEVVVAFRARGLATNFNSYIVKSRKDILKKNQKVFSKLLNLSSFSYNYHDAPKSYEDRTKYGHETFARVCCQQVYRDNDGTSFRITSVSKVTQVDYGGQNKI